MLSEQTQAINKECMFVLNNDEELEKLYGKTPHQFAFTVCRQPAKITVQVLLDPILLKNIGISTYAKLTTYAYFCADHQNEIRDM